MFEEQLDTPPILKGLLSHCEDFGLYSEMREGETVEAGAVIVITDKCNHALLHIQMRDDGGLDQTWKACVCIQQLCSKLLSGVLIFLQIR